MAFHNLEAGSGRNENEARERLKMVATRCQNEQVRVERVNEENEG